MPYLYVAKNPKYSIVSRNKPNVEKWWIIQDFIELECSEETYKSDHVYVDRKNKKAYSNEKEIPIQIFNRSSSQFYIVTPDNDYYDPAMEYNK